MKKIIGLVGPKGSGKTTLANALVLKHEFRRVSFASPLKFMLRSFLLGQGVSMETATEMLEGTLKETPTIFLENKTPRHAMQTLGTEWGRNLIGPDLWINAWKRHVQNHFKNVVTDDLRFLNEANAVKSLGGTVILISREGHLIDDSHVSEQELKSIPTDYVVTNIPGKPEHMLELLYRFGAI